jgi:hypothetical protein
LTTRGSTRRRPPPPCSVLTPTSRSARRTAADIRGASSRRPSWRHVRDERGGATSYFPMPDHERSHMPLRIYRTSVPIERLSVAAVGCAVLLHLNSFISPYHSPTADRTARATVRATTRHPHGSLSVEGGATPAYLSLSDLTLIWRLYYPDTSHLGQAPLSRQTETRYRTKHYTVTSSVSHEHTYPSKQHATVRFAFCRV